MWLVSPQTHCAGDHECKDFCDDRRIERGVPGQILQNKRNHNRHLWGGLHGWKYWKTALSAG